MLKRIVRNIPAPLGAVLAVAVLMTALYACGSSRKVSNLKRDNTEATLQLPSEESMVPEFELSDLKSDTLLVRDDQGNDIILMKAIKDEASGEMVANEVLKAAYVTARFRNKAERHGKVDLEFQVVVPKEMQDTRWQLRFYPEMFILEDSLRLEPVIITGVNYRKGQLRGYQQYQRFLNKIVSDTTKFIDVHQLEVFLKRNIPYIYSFKYDESFVDDELFYSYYGVSEQQAVDHYTNMFLKKRNQRRIANKGKMYAKYVKTPIISEGIRLDTVIQNSNGDFIYNYVQTINTRPRLRKVDVVLAGAIYEQDKEIYTVPRTEPLTFYISSISAFANLSERYLTRVIERKALANASYEIEFAVGRNDIREDLADNAKQIALMKENIVDLMSNDVFDLDSVVVVANASPEGTWSANDALSRRRGESVVTYFNSFMNEHRRKIAREGGFSVDEQGNIVTNRSKIPGIRFTSRSVPENWTGLDRLVRDEVRLTDEQKQNYFAFSDMKDGDAREARMRGQDYYGFLKDTLYPRLRVVDFSFHMHRKGMIKDTVHTTELDQHYMKGVRLLRDMAYDEAVKILGPYQDFNAALAYMAVDRNASAMLILQNLPSDPKVNYLLAILHSRNGDNQKAVQCYLDACRKDPSYIHRGNLDPEISALIKAYGLNKQPDDDLGY